MDLGDNHSWLLSSKGRPDNIWRLKEIHNITQKNSCSKIDSESDQSSRSKYQVKVNTRVEKHVKHPTGFNHQCQNLYKII